MHPHAVELYDHGQTESGLPWMAMELVRGKELSELIKELGALSPERTSRLMLQVLGALADAHAMQIVHRDLKPNNILVVSTGQSEFAKVLDFGIGKAIGEGEDKSLQDVTGHFGDAQTTPHYTPPEVLKGGAASPASDVYSLGLILSEMLTGEQAMGADTLFEVFAKQARQKVKLPKWLESSPLGPIIHKATEKEPAQRYANAGEMQRALQPIDVKRILAPKPMARPQSLRSPAPLPTGPIVSSKGYGPAAFSLPRPASAAVSPMGLPPLPRPQSGSIPAAHALLQEADLNDEPASQSRPASGPQSKPASGPQSKPASGPQSKPASGPQSKPASGPQSKPASGPQSKPASGPQSKPASG
ncbi:MAG: protein kinase, partial [Myxococcota bacterium]|nr:protein kinase [Myxococcota bacterium]